LAKVTITEGPDKGKTFEFAQAAILGRLDSNDVPIRDGKASREHAKIYRQGQQFAIVDLNSSNGTFVNGQKITKRVLEPGDEVSIGMVHLRFEDPEAEERKAGAAGSRRKTLEEAVGSGGAKPATATAATPAAAGGKIDMRGHQPIQYSRVKAGSPLLGIDLEQMSDTARVVLRLVLVAVFAGLVYLGYVLASGG
jgi:pSer/pThr/pTyr-binding forkhead associated (FHA) protein